MDSASIQFVLFGLAAAVVLNFNRSVAWRSAILMLASLLFVGLLVTQPTALLPLAGFLLLGYLGLKVCERTGNRFTAWIVVLILLVYVWLKQYTFLPAGAYLHFPYMTLGLSYIFFRVLHLVIDAGSDTERPRTSLFSYLLYTINFTSFVSGPIQRYDDFARDQFAQPPQPLSAGLVGLQLERIIRGLFKVNILGMLLQNLQQDMLDRLTQSLPGSPKLFAAIVVGVVYPIFLYCNFSGYIDIVIALARLMRIRLPENFDRPFAAASFIDFWNHWHMTLSAWLKTYVFNPLLVFLMRRITLPAMQPLLAVICFFVTFFLVGLWHGRTSEFLFFGVLQGAGVAGNKLWQLEITRILGRKGYKALAANSIYTAFSRGLTFAWFAFTLFWFWASWMQIHSVFGALGVGEWCVVWLIIWCGATVVLAIWEWARAGLIAWKTAEGPVFLSRYARIVYATVMGFVFLVLNFLLNQPAPGIVYKQF